MRATAVVLASVIGAALASPSPAQIVLNPLQLSTSLSSCPANGPISCHNSSRIPDLCCFESPGGLLLQTQFWDTHPSTGPEDSWTIHGLWPDNCDTTFNENCDPSRAYTDIASLLTDNGATDTLNFMETYWVDMHGENEQFWEHEWSKHGTCMSTLNPQCLPSGSPDGFEAVLFFQTVVSLFQSLPTYTWLANEGITPSHDRTYTLSELLSALKRASGGIEPALDCKSGALNAVSWYFNVKGSIADGTFVPINAPKHGDCHSSSRIKYLPKTRH